MQQHTQDYIDQLVELANLTKQGFKEPQSEEEEVKGDPNVEK